jgi:hypothetical protein
LHERDPEAGEGRQKDREDREGEWFLCPDLQWPTSFLTFLIFLFAPLRGVPGL